MNRHSPRPARHHALGFTVIELLIVVAIILTVAAIAVPNLMAAMDEAKIARAVGDVHTIGIAVQEYDLLNGQYPDTLADTDFGSTLDPWGNPYQYVQPGKSGPYDIICYGADGKEGGSGADADITNWDQEVLEIKKK